MPAPCSRWRAASAPAACSRPAPTAPCASRREVAAALGLPHPIDAATAARATDKLRAAPGVRRAPACRSPAWSERRQRAARRPRASSSSPPAAQGQRGLEIVEPGGDLARGRRRGAGGLARRPGALRGVRRGPGADGQRVHRRRPLRPADGHRSRARAGVRRRDGAPLPVACTRSPTSSAAAEAACARARHHVRADLHPGAARRPAAPRVMEVAARLGGGHDAELCAAALGVDLSAAAVLAALGRAPGPLGAGARSRGRRALPDRARRPARARRGPRRGARAARGRARALLPRAGRRRSRRSCAAPTAPGSCSPRARRARRRKRRRAPPRPRSASSSSSPGSGPGPGLPTRPARAPARARAPRRA